MKTWFLPLCTCLLLSHCREEQSTAPQQAEQLEPLRPAIFTTGIAAQCENRIRADLQRNIAALHLLRNIRNKQTADDTARQLQQLFSGNGEQPPEPDLAALPREQELALDNAYYHQWEQTAQQWETILNTLSRHQHHQSAALQQTLESIKNLRPCDYLLNPDLLHSYRSRPQPHHLAAIAETPDLQILRQEEKDFTPLSHLLNNVSDHTTADAAAAALLNWKTNEQIVWQRLLDERRDPDFLQDMHYLYGQQSETLRQHKKRFIRQRYYGSEALRQACDNTAAAQLIRQAQTALRDDLQTLISHIRQVHDRSSAETCATLIHQFVNNTLPPNFPFGRYHELPDKYTANIHIKTAMLLAPLFETFWQENDRLQTLQYFGSGALEKAMSHHSIYLPFWGLGNYYTYGEDSFPYLLTSHMRARPSYRYQTPNEQPAAAPEPDAIAYAEAYTGITALNNRLNSLLSTITDEQTAAAALPGIRTLVEQIETAYMQARPALAAATHRTHILQTPTRNKQELASVETYLLTCLLEEEEYHLTPELETTLRRLKQTSTRETELQHARTVAQLHRLNDTLAAVRNKTSADAAADETRQLIRQADAYNDIIAILGFPERTASPLDGHERISDRYENLRKTLEQRNCYGSDRLQQAFYRLSQIGSR